MQRLRSEADTGAVDTLSLPFTKDGLLIRPTRGNTGRDLRLGVWRGCSADDR